MCVLFPFILDIKFVGRTSRGHTGGRSHRISHQPSFCGETSSLDNNSPHLCSSPIFCRLLKMRELLLGEYLSSSMSHGNIHASVAPQFTDESANRNRTVLQPANQPIPVQHGRLNWCTALVLSYGVLPNVMLHEADPYCLLYPRLGQVATPSGSDTYKPAKRPLPL